MAQLPVSPRSTHLVESETWRYARRMFRNNVFGLLVLIVLAGCALYAISLYFATLPLH